MVMEYCIDDLAAILDEMKKPFPEPMVKFIMKQLLQALSYLHLNFIVHRDVKLSNLLLSSNGVLKLGMFNNNLNPRGHVSSSTLTKMLIRLYCVIISS